MNYPDNRAEMKNKNLNALQNLADLAKVRREILLDVALHRHLIHKRLSMTSGILALISAATITSVLTKLVGSFNFQIIAAILAFTAGIISLISSNYKDDETSKIFSGSAKYLELRNKIIAFTLNPINTEAEFNKHLEVFEMEYVKLDGDFSRYFDRRRTKRFFLFASQERFPFNNKHHAPNELI